MDDKKKIKKIKEKFEKIKKPVFVLSLYDDEMTKKLMDGLVKILRKE